MTNEPTNEPQDGTASCSMYNTIRDVGGTISLIGSPEEISAKARESQAPSSGFFGSLRNAIIGTTTPESKSKPQESQVPQSVDTDDLIEEANDLCNIESNENNEKANDSTILSQTQQQPQQTEGSGTDPQSLTSGENGKNQEERAGWNIFGCGPIKSEPTEIRQSSQYGEQPTSNTSGILDVYDKNEDEDDRSSDGAPDAGFACGGCGGEDDFDEGGTQTISTLTGRNWGEKPDE